MLRPVAASEAASARVGCQSREDNLCRPRQETPVLKGEFRDRLRSRRRHRFTRPGSEPRGRRHQLNGQKILAQDAGTRPTNTGHRPSRHAAPVDARSAPHTDLAGATGGHLASVNGSASLVDALDSALESIGRHRATLGAAEHRLQAAAETSELRCESSARSLVRLTSADPAAPASAMQQLLSLFG